MPDEPLHLIPHSLAVRVINYLGTCPHRDVNELIAGMMTLPVAKMAAANHGSAQAEKPAEDDAP